MEYSSFPERHRIARPGGLADAVCPDESIILALTRLFGRPAITMMALLGPRGVGKTQLLTHLGYDFYVKHGKGARYHTAAAMLEQLRDTFDRVNTDDKTYTQVYRPLVTLPLLVLDEFEVRKQSDWEFSTLTNIIDFRYRAGLVTVMASNLEPGPFRRLLGESAWSRLGECGAVLQCNWPSWRPDVAVQPRTAPARLHPQHPAGSPSAQSGP